MSQDLTQGATSPLQSNRSALKGEEKEGGQESTRTKVETPELAKQYSWQHEERIESGPQNPNPEVDTDGGGSGSGGGSSSGDDVALDTPTDGMVNKPLDPEKAQEVRQTMFQNMSNPELPAGAIQEAKHLEEKEGEALDPNDFQMEPVKNVEATLASQSAAKANHTELKAAVEAQLTTVGTVEPVLAASYAASQAAASQANQAAKGEISQLVTAATSTAANAEAAIQELDKVDPRSLMEAQTHDIPNGATVQGQLNGLLEGLESGEVPQWAKPAMAQAEALMASRGMSSSSVGRNAMFNSIITAAMPIAQQDAKAKLSVFQQDVSNEQQAALANSQFFQNLTIKNLDNKQQAAMLNATNLTNVSMSNAQNATQAQIENAKNFLAMDIQNMTNEQQTNVINSQLRQQSLLSNQAAENTAKQFNATSQMQTDQFNTNLKVQVDTFNATQANAMSQFNAAEVNKHNQLQGQMDQQTNLQNAQMAGDLEKFNSQQQNALAQFNSQQGFARDQFNTQNATAIAQSNVQWRRQMNQSNTASDNAVMQANAMNQFQLSNQALSFLWQEQRDAAKWANDNTQNEEERKTRMAIAALSNESMQKSDTLENIRSLAGVAASIFDNWG